MIPAARRAVKQFSYSERSRVGQVISSFGG
jgi:hypothetical protein